MGKVWYEIDMRVLIVEDEQNLRTQLSDQLKACGYAVDSAPDGNAGCFQGMEYTYDAAVIDLGLPQMSGMDLIKKPLYIGKTSVYFLKIEIRNML